MAEKQEGPEAATPEHIADLIAEDRDVDVLFVNAGISRQLDATLAELSRKRRRRTNVLLIMVTEGGDADAGYKIARCLQEKYKSFSFLVSGYCKSAGTLVALGANEIIVADMGELGPLDVQMSKPDELMQLQSGLTATAALEALDQSAYSSFERFFLTTIEKGGGGISTRTATQIAVQMASALYAPIYGHVDAMHVGEAGRALAIAEKYGERLLRKSQNALPGALGRLTTSYPSHGFVIDRREAKSLFRRVREPDALEQALIDLLAEHALEPRSGPAKPMVAYLSNERPEISAHPESSETSKSVGDVSHVPSQPSAATARGDGSAGGDVARTPANEPAHVIPISTGTTGRDVGNIGPTS